jgi:hypothetical protein
MGKERFEQWLYDTAYTTVKHIHGDNGIFASDQYQQECAEKGQSQSFSGVGAQHVNQGLAVRYHLSCCYEDSSQFSFGCGCHDKFDDLGYRENGPVVARVRVIF